MKVLITGGAGKCGTALKYLMCEKIFIDQLPQPESLKDETFFQGDLNDLDLLRSAMYGCHAVIHLATRPIYAEDTERTLTENIEGIRSIMKVAKEEKIERIIFASTSHVVGMYEEDHAPQIYREDNKITLDKFTPLRPDSTYGVSKCFGEELGRFEAENGGPKFYALRIGAVLFEHNDHPFAYAEMKMKQGQFEHGTKEYDKHVDRLKAMWLSRKDLVQMIALMLQYKGPVFDIFYGTSDNNRTWLDISYAKQALGYKPKDNSENWHSPTEQLIKT